MLLSLDRALTITRMRVSKRARELVPMDQKNSHSPFPHDSEFFRNLRPDQVPRFLRALTHPEELPTRTMSLDALVAIQNRVDTKKVEAIREKGVTEEPVVCRIKDINYLSDGHHRATASWLNGENSIKVRYKDLTKVDNSVKARLS